MLVGGSRKIEACKERFTIAEKWSSFLPPEKALRIKSYIKVRWSIGPKGELLNLSSKNVLPVSKKLLMEGDSFLIRP